MRRVLHISDLHFGRTNELLADTLLVQTRELQPDLVVVSGDLTQRARPEQFRTARRFLDALEPPKIVVPGNHDVPLEHFFDRLIRPLARYRRYISEDLYPTYNDDELAVIGVNTARSFTRASGSISDQQIQHARRFFCRAKQDTVRILVTHHPFDFPYGLRDKYLLRRARHAVASLADCQADVYLAGHAHVPFAGLSARRYTVAHHTALIVQAGTSVSMRTRSEPNSFNLIHVHRPSVSVEHFFWNERSARFVSTTVSHFNHTSSGWRATDKDNSGCYLAG
jgi:3',5'-cyclic AMP phosphodiesterase CpdA